LRLGKTTVHPLLEGLVETAAIRGMSRIGYRPGLLCDCSSIS
jgi:hypothetical protein